MVTFNEIRRGNAAFTAGRPIGLICVFVGATAGIGYATLMELIGMIRSSTFYVLGRNPSRYVEKLDALKRIEPSNKIIFIETQVALISEIDNACKQITTGEKKIDIIFLSPGGIPFQGAVYTEEGLEAAFAVSYYSRLRIVSNLLPLLTQSAKPRVLSVLNGTKETKIDESDIGLESNWGIVSCINHTTLCTSLVFDYLASNDSQKRITFLHVTPGLVYTKTPRSVVPTKAHGLIWWAIVSVLQVLSEWVTRLTGMDLKESGERHAFELTSEMYGPGSWRLDKSNNVVPDNEILTQYRQNGWGEKIWEFTQSAWNKALTKRS